MNKSTQPIPERLNLFLSLLMLCSLVFLFWAAGCVAGWWLLGIAIAYGLIMNSAYAMLHEAEHGLLHCNRRINDGIGVILALFFPAPFHLLRQGHIGHHIRNRSDDEAFDFYFEGENPIWKRLQLYGTLTGFFWLAIVIGTAITAVWPTLLRPRRFSMDRPTEALLQSLNPRFIPLVWMESMAVVLLHSGLIILFQIPILHWFATLAGFGIMWSAMQYVHHFGTERDVLKGALNLRTWRWLDALWLHHNWHLRHHQNPTVPWIYLPHLETGTGEQRPHLLPAWFRMWRGPRFTKQRVENRHVGPVIRS
jgi:fatty acid desaturase